MLSVEVYTAAMQASPVEVPMTSHQDNSNFFSNMGDHLQGDTTLLRPQYIEVAAEPQISQVINRSGAADHITSNSRQREELPLVLAPASPRNQPRGHQSPESQRQEYLLILARRDAASYAEGFDQGKPLLVPINH